MTVTEFEAEYGPSIDGAESTEPFVVTLAARDIGFIQCYHLVDHPDHERLIGVEGGVGIDYFIADPDLIGRGVGTRMIGEFIATVIRRRHPDARTIVADPEVANEASCRVLEKNGFHRAKVFEGKYGDEQLMVLELTAADPAVELSPS